MNIRYAILVLSLVLLGSGIQAGQPITFASSGGTVSIALANDDRPVRSVVLSAYGRIWTKPGVVTDRIARIQAPKVRVPTVFRITPAKDKKRTLGEAVVYPAPNAGWANVVIFYGAGVPKWFNQWTQAIGHPVFQFTEQKFKKSGRNLKDKKKLLVIGGESAGKKFADVIEVAKKHDMNILVLDAGWFGSKSGKVAIGPRQMACELAAIGKQKWPVPMMFSSTSSPWSGVANRRAWIAGKSGQPLIEEIINITWGWKIVVSYLPWAEQLGRCEAADKTLRSVLSAAAEPAPKLPQRMPDILYPSQRILEETKKQRPVLTAASGAWDWIKDIPSRVHVIDLRGRTSPPPEFGKTLKWLANRDGKSPPLLVLGDDPLLDNWKWANIDRKKRTFKRSGVVWMPDDALSPPQKTQIRLMLKLTELGIPLKILNAGEKG
jgi:hypothetical protein